MADMAEFGMEIGRELLASREGKGLPRSHARAFVRSVIEVEPRAKLPAILANAKVVAWMASAGITAAMLREELAAIRKVTKAEVAHAKEAEVKLPPQRRRSSIKTTLGAVTEKSTMAEPNHSPLPALPGADLFAPAVVPN